jgi:carbonic anhydrase
VVANVLGPLELDSIEYAAIYLHFSVILVLGHENCRAVKAVIDETTQDIESLATLIGPWVQEERLKNAKHLLEPSIKAKAFIMKGFLLNTPVIQKLVLDKKIEVFAAYYHLEIELVEIL